MMDDLSKLFQQIPDVVKVSLCDGDHVVGSCLQKIDNFLAGGDHNASSCNLLVFLNSFFSFKKQLLLLSNILKGSKLLIVNYVIEKKKKLFLWFLFLRFKTLLA
jgi:hypothetical protein